MGRRLASTARLAAALWLGATGCADDSDSSDGDGAQSGEDETSGNASASTSGSSGEGGHDASADESAGSVEDSGGPKLDVAPPDTDGLPPGSTCKVVDGMDAIGDCDAEAPPDSFTPDVQWTFDGVGDDTASLSVPVVINLTDDNGDGEVDLCDTPDVVASLYPPDGYFDVGHLYVLDGETGELHFMIDHPIAPATHAATGDIDGDGLPEIVTLSALDVKRWGGARLVAFSHEGEVEWIGDTTLSWGGGYSVGLADLDTDGDVEIMIGGHIADHEGHAIFDTTESAHGIGLSFAADLDGDDDMEVLTGPFVYHHDGELYWDIGEDEYGPQYMAHAQVANLDEDDDPEVLVTGGLGAMVFEHDGTPKPPAFACSWAWMPAAVHDIDGDGTSDIAASSHQQFCVAHADLSLMWSSTVMDDGFAGGTAFDFLGSGTAQAMYADNTQLYVFGGAGEVLLTAPRSSVTQTEFPVVADVDNDGSAEIVVVSNAGYGTQTSPAVQVIRDAEDRWIQARRIWNQHTYHVTNVREDGSIPQFEPKHWLGLNTFRTQAQITADGDVCQPIPEG